MRVDTSHMSSFRAIVTPASVATLDGARVLDYSVSMGVIREWCLGYKGAHITLRFTRPSGRYEELFWPDSNDDDVDGLVANAIFRVLDMTVEPVVTK